MRRPDETESRDDRDSIPGIPLKPWQCRPPLPGHDTFRVLSRSTLMGQDLGGRDVTVEPGIQRRLATRRWLRLGCGAALVGGICAVAGPTRVAAAGCNDWSGAVDSNWSTSGNWSLGAPVTGQALCFSVGAANVNSMNDDIAGLSVSGLTFSDNVTYGVSGDQLSLSGAPAAVSVTPTASTSSAFLVLNNPISLATSTTITGPVEFSGAVSGAGAINVMPNSFGQTGVVFAAASAFSGGVTANAGGAAVMGITGGLGTGPVTVQPTAELVVGLFASSPAAVVVDNPISLAGAGPYDGALECGQSTVDSLITLTADAKISGQVCRFDGVIDGPFTLTLRAPYNVAGEFTIDGVNTYSGGTLLQQGDGVVTVNGSSPLGSGPVTVSAGAKLGGIATIGDVASSGLLVPGDGATTPGSLTVGSLTFAQGDFATQINSASSYSALQASGPVNIQPSTALDVALAYTPTAGTQFTIIHNASGSPVTGSFAGLPEGATFVAGGWTFAITYKGGGGNDVVITALAVAPTSGGGGPSVPGTGARVTNVLVPGICLLFAGLSLILFAFRRVERRRP
jgi:fibronectin-binding autotransporter adhesin